MQPDAYFGNPLKSLQHVMYSLREDALSSYAPLCTCYNLPWLPEAESPAAFVYPSEMYYFAKTNVLNAYLPAFAENVLKKKFPDQDSEGVVLRPLRLLHNAVTGRFAVLSAPTQQLLSATAIMQAGPTPSSTRIVFWHASKPDTFAGRAARDGCWANEALDQLLLLSDGGRRAELLLLSSDRPLSAVDLGVTAKRVFSTPLRAHPPARPTESWQRSTRCSTGWTRATRSCTAPTLRRAARARRPTRSRSGPRTALRWPPASSRCL